MRTQLILASVLLAGPGLLLPFPTADADAPRIDPVPIQGWGTCEDPHGVPQVPCALYAEAELSLGPCDERACAYRVDSGAYLTARVASLLYLTTDVDNGAGACFGPPAVWREGGELNAACGRVCETWRVGRAATCEGSTLEGNPAVHSLPLRAGECGKVFVLNYATWGYAAQNVYVIFQYEVCRTGADGFDVAPSVFAASPRA